MRSLSTDYVDDGWMTQPLWKVWGGGGCKRVCGQLMDRRDLLGNKAVTGSVRIPPVVHSGSDQAVHPHRHSR